MRKLHLFDNGLTATSKDGGVIYIGSSETGQFDLDGLTDEQLTHLSQEREKLPLTPDADGLTLTIKKKRLRLPRIPIATKESHVD